MEKYKNSIVKDIKELVKIPSVYEDSEKYLFGKNIDDCLNKALEIMDNLGFKTFRPEDGAYGYAEIGTGEMIGVLGHLDVVPARFEDGWEHNPFEPVEKDGYLCGRGVQDDKGPMIIAAYALKSLLDEGYELKKRVRFILGLDEESLWRSIDIYKKREEAPVCGFSPDSKFPLTYAEKGLLQIKINGEGPVTHKVCGGDAFNAVAAFASCDTDASIENACKKLNFKFTVENGKINVEGTTAHAKNPWKGENSIINLCKALKESGCKDKYVEFISDKLYNQFRFEGFSDKNLSDFSGPVTVNLGKISTTDNSVEMCLDLRLPSTLNKDDVMEMIRNTVKQYGFTVEEYDWLGPIYVPVESDYIQNLIKAYVNVTGDTKNEPVISAGATYARAFPNCVAYGAVFVDDITTEHQPNEKISIDSLIKAGEVYKEAFKLCAF